MKKRFLPLIGACVLLMSLAFVGCSKEKENPTSNNTPISSKISEPTKNPSLDKLKNDSAEDAARTLLRSLCENDYELFLLISNKGNSTDVKDRFDNLKKGYNNKNYQEISLTPDKEKKDAFTTFKLDSNGEKIIYGKNNIGGERAATVQIIIKESEDGKYYFSSWFNND